VVVTDKWGFITLFNERAAALTGWKAKKALGKPLDQVVRFLDVLSRDPIAPPLPHALLEPAIKRNHDQALLVTAKGPDLPVQLSIAPMAEPDGPINGAIVKIIQSQPSRS
jgi:PAS domain S-box-containing protein